MNEWRAYGDDRVVRLHDGRTLHVVHLSKAKPPSWAWSISRDFMPLGGGTEPTREAAQRAAEKAAGW